jgi:hypothetical protein
LGKKLKTNSKFCPILRCLDSNIYVKNCQRCTVIALILYGSPASIEDMYYSS